LKYHELGAAATADEMERAGADALTAEQFLAAVVVKPAAWHRFGLPPHIREWLEGLVAQRPTVVACLGAPQGIEPFGHAAALVCALSDVPASQSALVEVLSNSAGALAR
jgi:beta-N-acetylhexosaminidase